MLRCSQCGEGLSIIFLLSIDYKACKTEWYLHLEHNSTVDNSIIPTSIRIDTHRSQKKNIEEYQRCHFYSFQTGKILINRLWWLLLFWWVSYSNSIINRISWSICNIIFLTCICIAQVVTTLWRMQWFLDAEIHLRAYKYFHWTLTV